MVAGRKICETFDAPDEAAAVAWVMEMERRPELLDSGAWQFEVELYIREAEAAGRLSPGYAENRRRVLLVEGERMGFTCPRDVSAARVQAWYSDVVSSARVSLVSLNHYFTHLRVFVDWLVKEGKLYESPLKLVKCVPSPDNTRDVFLSAPEVADLLAASRVAHAELTERWPARAEAYPVLELYLLLTCECGLRKGEVDAARAEWVDLERGLLVIPAEDVYDGHVWQRKGRSGRRRGAVVPLVEGLRAWFELHGVPSPYLIKPEKRWREGARCRYDVREKLGRLFRANGVGHVTIHDLRRSFGSNRVSAGTSIEKVANWMGISIQTAWSRYARFLPADADIERGAAVPSMAVDDVPEVAVSGGADRSVRSRLLDLRGLLDEGLISTEDFELKKSEILGGL